MACVAPHGVLFRGASEGKIRRFLIEKKNYIDAIMWDVVTRDYSKWMTAEDVVNNVKRYARNGSIITFHDSLNELGYLLSGKFHNLSDF